MKNIFDTMRDPAQSLTFQRGSQTILVHDFDHLTHLLTTTVDPFTLKAGYLDGVAATIDLDPSHQECIDIHSGDEGVLHPRSVHALANGQSIKLLEEPGEIYFQKEFPFASSNLHAAFRKKERVNS